MDRICVMNNPTPLITYDWVSKRRYWFSCAVSPVFLLAGLSFVFIDHIGWRLAGGALITLGFFMLVQKETAFDKAQGVFHVRHRLVGRYLVWIRALRLDEFDAVVLERNDRGEDGKVCQLGLRRKLGRPYWLCSDSYSSLQPSRRIEEFAWKLSCDTGLEVVEVEV